MTKKVEVTVQVNGTAIKLTGTAAVDGKPGKGLDGRGGNAHLQAGDQMRWRTADATKPFTLTFSNFDSGDNARPFGADRYGPTPDTDWLTVTNTASTCCKYDVSIDGCTPLDPVIIVDKT